ncbi:response regulator [Paracoccus sp. CPCC 101403]|uniref:Response regulator n=1 Tax=Paracoccus broussonetiae TaxID=3075834 RepID=A0ABU3E9X0_9RHOB|nr:response regulator [Paracoccus sp. CPCC 101403]MDT1061019.1 response regulator [Paracoccus sp. CPCC 101403]
MTLKNDLPPLTSLLVFEAAGRLGSFSDAARELNVTREAVSRQIRALESHLGLSLFERNANNTALRDWGRHYHEAVSLHLDSLAQASRAISGETPTVHAATDPALDDGDAACILVVDDLPANIRRLHDVLRGRYEVVAHTNAPDALDWLAAGGRADLALLDVHMTGMDGYALCRRLKADPQHARLPVIFLTNLDTPQDETEGFAAGACDYIARPFAPAVLLARIEVQLDLRKTTAALEALLERRADRLERAEALLTRMQREIADYIG